MGLGSIQHPHSLLPPMIFPPNRGADRGPAFYSTSLLLLTCYFTAYTTSCVFLYRSRLGTAALVLVTVLLVARLLAVRPGHLRRAGTDPRKRSRVEQFSSEQFNSYAIDAVIHPYCVHC